MKPKGFYTKNGKVRPITSRTPKSGTHQQGIAHLGVPRRFGNKTFTLKSTGRNSDEVYHDGKFIGTIRKLESNSYLSVDAGGNFYKESKTQSVALKALSEHTLNKKQEEQSFVVKQMARNRTQNANR